MSDPKRDLFRQEAITHHSSPEQLDRAICLIGPVTWLPLLSVASLLGLGLIWSIWGRIPVTAMGKGIILTPKQVIPFQSPIAGQIQSLAISDGDCLESDQLIATIEPLDLKQQLQLARERFNQLQQQIILSRNLRNYQLTLEEQAIAAAKRSYRENLRNTRDLAPIVRQRNLTAILKQRQSIRQQLQHQQSLLPIVAEQIEVRKQLVASGALPKESILDVEREYLQIQDAIAELEADREQLDVNETTIEQQYLDNLNSITSIQANLQDLTARQTQSREQALQRNHSEQTALQTARREVVRLQQQIEINSRILAPRSGCILETTVSPGQVVETGTVLGTLNEKGKTLAAEPIGIIYFPVAEGKKIQAGMEVQIAPDTVKRARFGGIIGKVTAVSAYPVTSEGAIATLGNPNIALALVPQGSPQLEVRATLERDRATPSGYRWSSSQGPTLSISEGTTMTVRVKIEERAPIAFLLPILREQTGIY
ncbi:MAG: NHLP bacteriocin system secretion protein [Cyanobacteria bacterium SBLK]|nr:NHLP bacteriocin system secretion protein [Cyanobacteria bacterium SBLK]